MLDEPSFALAVVGGLVVLAGYLHSRQGWRRESWTAEVTYVDEHVGYTQQGRPYTEVHIEYRREDGDDGVYRFVFEERRPELEVLRRVQVGDELLKHRGEDHPHPARPRLAGGKPVDET